MQVSDVVQPTPNGLPENPETKRRLKNLLDVTGLLDQLHVQFAPCATTEQLTRVHPESYLNKFKEMSDNHGAERVAILDWDVHHGNGTEAIHYDRNDVLTTIHQEHNYPIDTGDVSDRGSGAGEGYNINIPLAPGCGHAAYVETMERIVIPALNGFAPDIIIVACGLDAGPFDPLAHMLVMARSFATMTQMLMEMAARMCDGKLVPVHEGGYSEAYVLFCGHAIIAGLANSNITAPDPLAADFGFE